jgi:uncharacterized protein YndB with AHSA1/START domain
MNLLIIILAGIVGIVALVLIAALFVKNEYEIERSVVVNRPVSDVFDYVRMLTNQDYFSKWVMTDPYKKTEHRGTDGTVGFVYGWNGNKEAGEGEQEIIGLSPNHKVNIEVRFVRPFRSTATTPFTLERISETQTKVTWGMEGRSRYPMNLMYLLLAGVLAKDLDTSLVNLKGILEQPNTTVEAPVR